MAWLNDIAVNMPDDVAEDMADHMVDGVAGDLAGDGAEEDGKQGDGAERWVLAGSGLQHGTASRMASGSDSVGTTVGLCLAVARDQWVRRMVQRPQRLRRRRHVGC